ncbi:MAG TPA: cytochrome c oxidase subunit II [Candidatus Binatia bacterium]|nr:cytochrome c oxidase subunit II [Candidatus Binatia bacterium]
MNLGFPLFPEQASTLAARVDALFYFLVAVTIFFVALIFVTIVFFAVKYRRRAEDERPQPLEGNFWLEVVWSVIPFGLTMVMFVWGAIIYFDIYNPPNDALEISIVGRQWMWKAQHPEGQSEINELHVPLGQPVKLTMTSEDVIHDFFLPAFRVKQDVLPGRYTSLWFEATKAGEYPLYCAEYCGTQHSGMIGRIVVLEPAEFQKWLSGGATGMSMADLGESLFQRFGCHICHRAGGTAQGPSLTGLFGKVVKLEGGVTVTVDEDYIRESIIDPRAKIVAGYQPIMPTFKGLVSEEGLLQLIAYIKSLSAAERAQSKK